MARSTFGNITGSKKVTTHYAYNRLKLIEKKRTLLERRDYQNIYFHPFPVHCKIFCNVSNFISLLLYFNEVIILAYYILATQ